MNQRLITRCSLPLAFLALCLSACSSEGDSDQQDGDGSAKTVSAEELAGDRDLMMLYSNCRNQLLVKEFAPEFQNHVMRTPPDEPLEAPALDMSNLGIGDWGMVSGKLELIAPVDDKSMLVWIDADGQRYTALLDSIVPANFEYRTAYPLELIICCVGAYDHEQPFGGGTKRLPRLFNMSADWQTMQPYADAFRKRMLEGSNE